MNQKKYLVTAVLLLFLLAGIYFIIRKFNTKVVENSSKVIDYVEATDSLPKAIALGKQLFQRQCASCHNIFKNATGPRMAGVSERWTDKKELFAFIRNPALVVRRNAYARKLKDEYKSLMTAFLLTDSEIQAILDYTRTEEKIHKGPIP